MFLTSVINLNIESKGIPEYQIFSGIIKFNFPTVDQYTYLSTNMVNVH